MNWLQLHVEDNVNRSWLHGNFLVCRVSRHENWSAVCCSWAAVALNTIHTFQECYMVCLCARARLVYARYIVCHVTSSLRLLHYFFSNRAYSAFFLLLLLLLLFLQLLWIDLNVNKNINSKIMKWLRRCWRLAVANQYETFNFNTNEIIVNLCIVIGVVTDGFGVYKIRLETQHAIFNRNCRYLWENIVHLSNLAFTHTRTSHKAHPVVCANANKNRNFIQMKYCSMARSVDSWRVQTDATLIVIVVDVSIDFEYFTTTSSRSVFENHHFQIEFQFFIFLRRFWGDYILNRLATISFRCKVNVWEFDECVSI